MLTLGIDDAGRGPVIGPMILAGVLADDGQAKKMKKEKIRDSKAVPNHLHKGLANFIVRNSLKHEIVKSFPEEIDESENLNTLEARKVGEIINKINIERMRKEKIKVIVDCPSNNLVSWRLVLMKFIEYEGNLEVVCEHKADENYVVVAAGSILAKFTREEEVRKIKKEYGEIGSGYPADPATKEFLKKKGKELISSGIFRKSWSTWKKMYPSAGQATLGDYSG